MSVNPTDQKEIKHLSYELEFLESEVGFKNHEKLLKTIENLSKQLNEVKSQLVRLFCDLGTFSPLNNNLIKTKKGSE